MMTNFSSIPFKAVPLALLLILGACSLGGPDTPADALSGNLAYVTATVPGFGGLGYDVRLRDTHGGAMLVVYTLGSDPAAAAEIERLIGSWEYVLRERPARGDASAERLASVERVIPSTAVARLDATTGYVRVGAPTLFVATQAIGGLESSGIPLSDVIIQIEGRHLYRPEGLDRTARGT